MGLLLNIETSSEVCSVALAKDGVILSIKESSDQNHASMLAPFIKEMMAEANVELSEIDAVAVSAGPGSYTGLRIGAATAKGICYALSKPLIAVDSLHALAWGMRQETKNKEAFYLPTIDARRNEIYYAVFDGQLNAVIHSKNIILSENFLEGFERNNLLIVAGSGTEKTFPNLSSFKQIIKSSVAFSAGWMAVLAEERWQQQLLEDTGPFEPNYLKPVFVTAAKQKLL